MFAGRGFASEESGFLIDQNVLLVSINYRFLMRKLGFNEAWQKKRDSSDQTNLKS